MICDIIYTNLIIPTVNYSKKNRAKHKLDSIKDRTIFELNLPLNEPLRLKDTYHVFCKKNACVVYISMSR